MADKLTDRLPYVGARVDMALVTWASKDKAEMARRISQQLLPNIEMLLIHAEQNGIPIEGTLKADLILDYQDRV